LLDFEGGLYGERLRVILELSIRSQVAFDSNEELTAQIRADVAAVRQYASRLAPRGDSARAKTSDDL
jgi:FAD synthase